ncbi:MAG: hypothetical protein ACI31G_05255 [Bacilli bacterium]
MNEKYIKYLTLPPFKSKNRKAMLNKDRAAQFMPFDALTGYKDLISEEEISSKEKIITLEDKNVELERKLQFLYHSKDEHIKVKIVYYYQNIESKKFDYVTKTGYISSFSSDKKSIYLNKTKINIKDIYDIIIDDVFKEVDSDE